MRLFLSSSGVLTIKPHWQRLHDMAGSSNKVLFINNAKDYYTLSERTADVAEKIKGFKEAGFDAKELDLRNYFDSQEDLKELIDKTSFIWASGGNEFLLRKAYAYSGFDTLILESIKADRLLYGGSSAGMMILTKTLRGCEEWDDANFIPDGYESEVLWDGLGLVDVQLVPHYKSGWADLESDALIAYYERECLEYIALRDGEVYVVDGNKKELLT